MGPCGACCWTVGLHMTVNAVSINTCTLLAASFTHLWPRMPHVGAMRGAGAGARPAARGVCCVCRVCSPAPCRAALAAWRLGAAGADAAGSARTRATAPHALDALRTALCRTRRCSSSGRRTEPTLPASSPRMVRDRVPALACAGEGAHLCAWWAAAAARQPNIARRIF